jgi:[acyl-carrier-protein] S-malonyltransferase
MAAVLGLEPEVVSRVLAALPSSGHVVVPANFNSPEQTVISGHAEAVKAAEEALKAAGAKRVVALAVSAPFHSPLMAPAAEALRAVLDPISIRKSSAPVITNVEASPNEDPQRIKELLIRQVTAPVRWVESFSKLKELGVTDAVEFGPGKVLFGLGRRIDKSIRVHTVEDPATLAKTVEALAS